MLVGCIQPPCHPQRTSACGLPVCPLCVQERSCAGGSVLCSGALELLRGVGLQHGMEAQPGPEPPAPSPGLLLGTEQLVL